jgi:hypothetical protein
VKTFLAVRILYTLWGWGDNLIKWIDLCVSEVMFGGTTLPCDWIEVDSDVAYLKNESKGKVIGRDDFNL